MKEECMKRLTVAVTLIAMSAVAGSAQAKTWQAPPTPPRPPTPPASTCMAGSVDSTSNPGSTMCFGSMFPKLAPFRFSDQDAADLVATMEDQHTDPPGVDQGTQEDSPTLPSEYT